MPLFSRYLRNSSFFSSGVCARDTAAAAGRGRASTARAHQRQGRRRRSRSAPDPAAGPRPPRRPPSPATATERALHVARPRWVAASSPGPSGRAHGQPTRALGLVVVEVRAERSPTGRGWRPRGRGARSAALSRTRAPGEGRVTNLVAAHRRGESLEVARRETTGRRTSSLAWRDSPCFVGRALRTRRSRASHHVGDHRSRLPRGSGALLDARAQVRDRRRARVAARRRPSPPSRASQARDCAVGRDRRLGGTDRRVRLLRVGPGGCPGPWVGRVARQVRAPFASVARAGRRA